MKRLVDRVLLLLKKSRKKNKSNKNSPKFQSITRDEKGRWILDETSTKIKPWITNPPKQKDK
jgi:hypothetical protein